MRKNAFFAASAGAYLLASVTAMAQDTSASQLGKSIGGLLFGNPQRQEDAYMRGQMDGAIVAERMAHAEQMRREAETLERTRLIQDRLRGWMVSGGLPPDQANSIAIAYRPMPEEAAIIDRARRDGSQATLDGIKKAYDSYNYLLVDQLILGWVIARQDEQQAATHQPIQEQTAAETPYLMQQSPSQPTPAKDPLLPGH